MSTQPLNDPNNFKKVSIIMNCFNCERYVREAIDSVYEQTYDNWEIIFWDNASTDKSAEIALSYDERLRYFRGDETIPLGAARNKAIGKCQGDIIAFLDCDDLWLGNKLEWQMEAMESGNYALCYGGTIIIDSEGRKLSKALPKYKSGYIFKNLLRRYEINMQTVIIQSSMLQKCGRNFDSSLHYSPDFALFMDIAYGYKIFVIRKPIVKYRIHQRSLSNKIISRWANEMESVLNELTKKYSDIPERFEQELKYAYGIAKYYRARYYVSIGDKAAARKELKDNFCLDARYRVLYLLLFMPKMAWDIAHKVTGKY